MMNASMTSIVSSPLMIILRHSSFAGIVSWATKQENPYGSSGASHLK